MSALRTRLVSEAEYHAAHRATGSVYFIRDKEADMIKVGHSREPERRLAELQIGSSRRLEIVGLIAAEPAIEKLIHFQLIEGAVHGEWFWDREITTAWLMSMTQNQPMRRNIWDFVPSRNVLSIWHEETQSHTRHVWNDETQAWEPPLR